MLLHRPTARIAFACKSILKILEVEQHEK